MDSARRARRASAGAARGAGVGAKLDERSSSHRGRRRSRVPPRRRLQRTPTALRIRTRPARPRAEPATAGRPRRPAARLRDAGADAESPCARRAGRRLHGSSRGLSHGDARQRRLHLHRRLPRDARPAGQLRVLSARRRRALPEHGRAGQPAAHRGRRGGAAAHGAHARRAPGRGGAAAARRQRRLQRLLLSAQPHGRRRGHHSLRVRAAGRARRGGAPAAGPAPGRRPAQPRPQPLHRRRVSRGRSRPRRPSGRHHLAERFPIPLPTPEASGIRPPSWRCARWTRSSAGSRTDSGPPADWKRSTSG